MKKSNCIAYLSLIVLFSIRLQATDVVDQSLFSHNQKASAAEENILDSIVTYDYVNRTDSFPWLKSSYVYNTEGVSLVKINSRWNYDGSLQSFTWENEYKYMYGTDNMGNDTLFMYYEWNAESNRWKESDKRVRTYTDDGKLKSELDQFWHPDSGAWLTGSSIEIAYDENGYAIEYTRRLAHQQTNFELTPDYRIFYTYNEANLRISSTRYFWDIDREIFYRNDSTVIFYNEDSKDTLNLVYRGWINYSGWENDERILKEYDPAGNEISRITQLWDDLTYKYVNSEKLAHGYNEQNQLTHETSYHWVKPKQDWKGETQYTYEYDANGNILTEKIADWSVELNDWENVFTFIYDYDDLLLLSKSTAYDDFFYKEHYYYQGMSLIGLPEVAADELVLYPVPATHSIYFSGVQQLNSVRIYSTEGRLLKSLGPISANSAISLDGLNSGLYLFELTLNDTRRIVRRVMVK